MNYILKNLKKSLALNIVFVSFIALWSCGNDDSDKISVTPAQPPTIDSIEPTSGQIGTSITIMGTNFNTVATANTVTFNGIAAVVTFSTSTIINTSIPEGATTGAVSVKVAGKTVEGPFFTVTLDPTAPTIASVDPNRGTAGTEVTITGTNFSEIPLENLVNFNGTAAKLTASTATTITTTVPDGASTGPITVVVDDKEGEGPEFTVLPLPTITSIDPASGTVGTSVTITGTGFSEIASDNVIEFNGMEAIVSAATTTSITFIVPEGVGIGAENITISLNGGNLVEGPEFTVISGDAAITSIDPVTGLEATIVTITGTNFSNIASDNVVSFNGTEAMVSNSTATTITTSVPAGATTGAITVSVNGGMSVTGPEFTVTAGMATVAPTFTQAIMSGVPDNLQKIQFITATIVYAVGDENAGGNGTFIESTDAGLSWSDLSTNTGVIGVDLDNLFFLDANNGWVIGELETVLKTTDGGENWTSQNTAMGSSDDLKSIFFLDANNGYVGGEEGLLYHTTDGGANWTLQPSGTTETINNIFFHNGSSGIAVTSGGNIITTADGTSWDLQADVNGAAESWKAIQFVDANNGWVVGSGGFIFKTTDGGANWTAQPNPGFDNDTDYNDIILIDTDILIGVGDHNSDDTITSFVANTVNGGATWVRDNHGLTAMVDDIELNGIDSFDGSVIITVGDDGTILRN